MLLDDPVTHRQPQSGSLTDSSRRKEWLEDLGQYALLDARTCVAETDRHGIGLLGDSRSRSVPPGYWPGSHSSIHCAKLDESAPGGR